MKALVVLVTLAGVARATTSPTVAVLPFKDLSSSPGARGSIGEAIRETVTADLKDVPGLRVIERANLDKIIAEQNLQSSKTDLDAGSTVKVGRLLGATLMVAGAYQRAGTGVRLTARFVNVETGEIVGTAKVDGAEKDFLTLQDRVTVELLKSAGIETRHVQTIARRTRPKIKSWKTVELYGDAVVEPDDAKKQSFLIAALNEDPSFVYASRDLDALEKRMRAYSQAAQSAQSRRLKEKLDETHARLAGEKDPAVIRQLYHDLFDVLLQTRLWRTILVESKRMLDHPPPPAPAPPGRATLEETAAFYVVQAELMLKQRDALLRDGELFLKKFPTSVWFQSVRIWMNGEIDFKRKVEAGKTEAPAQVARLNTTQRWDLCMVGQIYGAHAQHKEAQRLFRACVAVGSRDKTNALLQLVNVDVELGDWAAARADLKALGEADHEHKYLPFHDTIEMTIPGDG